VHMAWNDVPVLEKDALHLAFELWHAIHCSWHS
jgi:hypothetical protein